MLETTALLFAATLFGGMMLFSFSFAPLLFSQMPMKQARTMLRNTFPWYYLFVIVTSAACLVLELGLDSVSAGLMAITLIIGIGARQALMPAINRATDTQLAGDSDGKRRFAVLHGLSVVLNFVQIGTVGWVIARFL